VSPPWIEPAFASNEAGISGLAAFIPDQFRSCTRIIRFVDVKDGDFRSFARHGDRCCATNATVASRDDRRLVTTPARSGISWPVFKLWPHLGFKAGLLSLCLGASSAFCRSFLQTRVRQLFKARSQPIACEGLTQVSVEIRGCLYPVFRSCLSFRRSRLCPSFRSFQ
jgi:hypothetical protein